MRSAMRLLGILVTWASVATVVWAFFLPWAYLAIREPTALRQLSRTADTTPLPGDLTTALGHVTVEVRHGLPNQVTGFEIPRVANQRDSQAAIALLELFTPHHRRRHDLGAQSYAVYAVPGLAILCGLLLTALGRHALVAVGIALLAAAVAGVGFWKLQTTTTETPFVAITIGEGLRLSLGAYAALALGALCVLVGARRRAHTEGRG